jgi:hypothetical protein
MQQELTLKITTARCPASFVTRSIERLASAFWKSLC